MKYLIGGIIGGLAGIFLSLVLSIGIGAIVRFSTNPPRPSAIEGAMVGGLYLFPLVALPALGLGALVGALGARLWRRQGRRPPTGCCQRCGYDLRGSAASGWVCPECGGRSP